MTELKALLHKPSVRLLLIILAGACAYANTLHVPFFLDDYDIIVKNSALDSLARFFTRQNWLAPPFKARWFSLLTFAFNKQWGGNSVIGFHLVNLAIHISCALLVYQLSHDTLVTFGHNSRKRLASAPLLAALLFVLHPVQTQAVTYIVQRMASLTTLLYLAALLLYLRAFSGTTGNHGIRRIILYCGALTACLLAMGSKEISLTLPLTLALFDLLFLDGSCRQRLPRLAPFALTLLILPFVIYGFGTGTRLATVSSGGTANLPLPHLTYLCTELRVLMTYLRLLILPVGQNFDYDFPVYNSLLQPPVFLSAISLTLLLAVAIMLLNSSRRSAPLPRIWGFAILWFFITIAVESGVIPLFDVIFEHRLYLPSVWLIMAAAFTLVELHQGSARFKGWIAAAIALFVVTLGITTYQRNMVWRTEVSLWSDVIAKAPGQERGWASLGQYHVKHLQPQSAIPLLERALAISPRGYQSLYNLGMASLQTGDAKRACDFFVQTTQIAPTFPDAWKTGGDACLMADNLPQAIVLLQRALERDPADFTTRISLQTALERERRMK